MLLRLVAHPTMQVWGGLCYMDFHGLKDGGELECTSLDPSVLPPLYLMWADSPSESGKVTGWNSLCLSHPEFVCERAHTCVHNTKCTQALLLCKMEREPK